MAAAEKIIFFFAGVPLNFEFEGAQHTHASPACSGWRAQGSASLYLAVSSVPPVAAPRCADLLQTIVAGAAEKYSGYTHWGPQILSLDYYTPVNGKKTLVKKIVECTKSDNDP